MLLKNMTVKHKILIALIVMLIIAMLVIVWIEAYWYCVELSIATRTRSHVANLTNALYVFVTDEYNDKIEEITVEDFNCENIKDVEVIYRMNNMDHVLLVKLKKTGKRAYLKTIIKIFELDFVKDASLATGLLTD